MKSRCMFDEQKTVIYFWFKDPSKLDSAAIARIALVINLSVNPRDKPSRV